MPGAYRSNWRAADCSCGSTCATPPRRRWRSRPSPPIRPTTPTSTRCRPDRSRHNPWFLGRYLERCLEFVCASEDFERTVGQSGVAHRSGLVAQPCSGADRYHERFANRLPIGRDAQSCARSKRDMSRRQAPAAKTASRRSTMTIADVAMRCGVSKSTVSRVLNGPPGAVAWRHRAGQHDPRGDERCRRPPGLGRRTAAGSGLRSRLPLGEPRPTCTRGAARFAIPVSISWPTKRAGAPSEPVRNAASHRWRPSNPHRPHKVASGPRGFLPCPWRLSDAGPRRCSLRPGRPASETLHNSCRSRPSESCRSLRQPDPNHPPPCLA